MKSLIGKRQVNKVRKWIELLHSLYIPPVLLMALEVVEETVTSK